jgi:alpha-1,6-mannosyltransferase
MVAGYFVVAVMAGAPDSPLTTPLPVGAKPPSWAATIARGLGLGHAGRPAIVVAALLVVAAILIGFAVLIIEAWSNRVRLSGVLVAAGASLAISVAAPLLLSRDVFSYAAYGRIYALYHHNPYVSVPASFRSDPFVSVTSQQWLHTRSLYGPVFTLASAGVVRAFRQSPGATIFAFKALAGVAMAAATAWTVLAARAVRPERAALAAALVGLNPVLVIHTVGGGHTDALIAAMVAGAMALAVTRRRIDPPIGLRSAGVTVLLTVATLIKVVILPVLVLWLWWAATAAPRRERLRTEAIHLGLVAGVAAALFAPFWADVRTLSPLATLAGVEGWASPARLVARGARAVVEWLAGSGAGAAADKAVVAAFLLAFTALFWRLRPRRADADPAGADDLRSPIGGWGSALLLLALAAPYLLPWYAAWFVPFLGLMRDDGLMWIGVTVGSLLALTLIPADPAHGYSTWGVMLGVHYVVAPLMLGLFLAAARRVVRSTARRSPTVTSRASP